MLFTSVAFAIFLPLVFAIYWAIGAKNIRAQNMLLVLASFVFYGWWDYRFVLLLLATTSFDFYIGCQLGKIDAPGKRKTLFHASIFLNLVTLAFFKYFNFFSENFAGLLHTFGFSADTFTLHILLPVGISFYTFHSMSYVIDIYHRRKDPCYDAAAFFAFISFFPLLVAGPIVRASWFLPQFRSERRFEPAKASDGLRQMLWGFFKKMVIADGCAHFVNPIFEHWGSQSSATLAAGAMLFAFQIYGDFSGYSDIAIGTSRLLGFHLLPNFRYPYFSRSITEFWRRWHISLSTWFNDYVFLPFATAYRNWGKAAVIAGVLLTFFLSGLWHGAGWNFIIFGLMHGIAMVWELLTKKLRRKSFSWLPAAISAGLPMILVFAYVSLADVFFRAANMTQAAGYLHRMCSGIPGNIAVERRIGVFIAVMLIVEWIARKREHGLELDRIRSRPLRWLIYMLVALAAFYFGAPAQTFIYFQF